MWREKQKKELGPGQDKIVRAVVTVILKVQQHWANGMGKFAARLSSRSQKIVLVFVAGTMSAFCFCLVYSGFGLEKQGDGDFIKPAGIIAPALAEIQQKARKRPSAAMIVYFKKVAAFRDSLKRKRANPALLDTRFPELRDSIRVFELSLH